MKQLVVVLSVRLANTLTRGWGFCFQVERGAHCCTIPSLSGGEEPSRWPLMRTMCLRRMRERERAVLRKAETSRPYGHCGQIGRLIFVVVCRAFGDAHQELQPEGEGTQTTSPAEHCVTVHVWLFKLAEGQGTIKDSGH